MSASRSSSVFSSSSPSYTCLTRSATDGFLARTLAFVAVAAALSSSFTLGLAATASRTVLALSLLRAVRTSIGVEGFPATMARRSAGPVLKCSRKSTGVPGLRKRFHVMKGISPPLSAEVAMSARTSGGVLGFPLKAPSKLSRSVCASSRRVDSGV